MAENKMKEVAQLLGVELNEEFNVKKCCRGNPYKFTKEGLYNRDGYLSDDMFRYLITGKLEIEKPILTYKEKEYLESVLKPFKEKNIFIVKRNNGFHPESEYLIIYLNENADIYDIKNREEIVLPFF